MHIALKLLTGEVIEKTVDESVVTIGRSPQCTIHVPHDAMSRNHCQIEIINGEVFVTDLKSTNGVYIDNEKIEPNQKVPYQTYLNLSFGAVLTAQIVLEDIVEPAQEISSFKSEMIPEKKTQSMAQTVVYSTPIRKEKKGLPGPQPNKSNNQNLRLWMNNALVFLLLAFAVYYYLNQDSDKIDYSNIHKIPKEEAIQEITFP
jgi:predicted component of type VI protein secretion system